MFTQTVPCWYLTPPSALAQEMNLARGMMMQGKQQGALEPAWTAHRACFVCPGTNMAHEAAPVTMLSLCAFLPFCRRHFLQISILGQTLALETLQATKLNFRCSQPLQQPGLS